MTTGAGTWTPLVLNRTLFEGLGSGFRGWDLGSRLWVRGFRVYVWDRPCTLMHLWTHIFSQTLKQTLLDHESLNLKIVSKTYKP